MRWWFLLLWYSIPAAALDLGLGGDVLHARGEHYLELRQPYRYGSLQVGHLYGWQVGGDLNLTDHLRLGLVRTEPDPVVGTAWRYSLRWEQPVGSLKLSLLHESNCASVCEKVPGMSWIPHGGRSHANRGWNVLLLTVPLC